ncbi:hypothetical protein Bbelb_083660 [Branchiostoma belcheri]|nr:hypothetical protein Bbelb_083660 [Branchiostoma belcheri]
MFDDSALRTPIRLSMSAIYYRELLEETLIETLCATDIAGTLSAEKWRERTTLTRTPGADWSELGEHLTVIGQQFRARPQNVNTLSDALSNVGLVDNAAAGNEFTSSSSYSSYQGLDVPHRPTTPDSSPRQEDLATLLLQNLPCPPGRPVSVMGLGIKVGRYSSYRPGDDIRWRVKKSGNTTVGTSRPVHVTPVPVLTAQKQNWTKYLKIRIALEEFFSPRVRMVKATTPAETLKSCLKDAARKKECSEITPIRHYSTCALVGNSGILLNGSCGHEIDTHDFVIRFNLGPLQDSWKDVGRNVNMTVVNQVIVRKLFLMFRENKTSEFLDLLRPFNNSVLLLAKGTSRWHVRTRTRDLLVPSRALCCYATRPHPMPGAGIRNTRFLNECRSMENLMLERGLNLTIALSNFNGTGDHVCYVIFSENVGKEWRLRTSLARLRKVMVWAWRETQVHSNHRSTPSGEAITFCDHVTLFGFYPFNKDRHNRRIPYHYWRDFTARPSGPKSHHTFVAEYKLLGYLINDGIINHTLDCNVLRGPKNTRERT